MLAFSNCYFLFCYFLLLEQTKIRTPIKINANTPQTAINMISQRSSHPSWSFCRHL